MRQTVRLVKSGAYTAVSCYRFRHGRNTAKLTVDEIDKFAQVIKKLVDSSPLIKWAIIAAGVGAIIDSVHILWLAARYVLRF